MKINRIEIDWNNRKSTPNSRIKRIFVPLKTRLFHMLKPILHVQLVFGEDNFNDSTHSVSKTKPLSVRS